MDSSLRTDGGTTASEPAFGTKLPDPDSGLWVFVQGTAPDDSGGEWHLAREFDGAGYGLACDDTAPGPAIGPKLIQSATVCSPVCEGCLDT